MHHFKVPFSDIPQFSFKDKFYHTNIQDLNEYLAFIPELKEIEKAIDQRMSFDVDRILLHQFLEKEYSKISASDTQKNNITQLKEKTTFTVCTAHQPCLLGGPSYYFYKIFSTIHLTELLNKTYTDYHFVPVFINGGEDHDFDEVNHLNLFGKKVQWSSSQAGPVGRFSTDGLSEVLDEIETIVRDNPVGQKFVQMYREALTVSLDYNDFVFRWVNAYFYDSGLLVMNMDNLELKKAFLPFMKKEILSQPSKKCVEDTQSQLSSLGFKPQAFAREINLFYLGEQLRERIIFEDNLYKVNNTSLIFSQEEMMEELDNFPDRFSPNVVLRPLYQEVILPNIAFIGGGGEVSYWIERKTQFAHFNVFFPMIIRRNSALVINSKIKDNIEKLGLTIHDFLGNETQCIQKYLDLHTSSAIHLDTYRLKVHDMIEEIQKMAQDIDITLEGYIGKEGNNISKSIENIEHKLVKAVKSKESVALNKITNIHSKINPNGGLQERIEHFLQFEMESSETSLSDYLLHIFNPFTKDYLVVIVE